MVYQIPMMLKSFNLQCVSLVPPLGCPILSFLDTARGARIMVPPGSNINQKMSYSKISSVFSDFRQICQKTTLILRLLKKYLS